MPHDVTLRGPVYTFNCFGVHEAKQSGLIDSWERQGTHAPVSTIFEHGEGKLLADWIAQMPDALLIATGRYQITVYRPKTRLIILPDDEMPLLEDELEEEEEAPEPNALEDLGVFADSLPQTEGSRLEPAFV